MDIRKKKRKVLLMGKSGSGKSSMRSIIFSNYVAKDVRRLGATIDVEHSHVKFMGSLTLNLWDCGGIWDQSLYKAWAGIVHKLIPNLSVIERFLQAFAQKIEAEEVILFERSTFLTVTSVASEVGRLNPIFDRHERLSNIMKAFKHCAARNTHTTPASASFLVMHTKTPQFNVFLGRFTDNTYIFVVVPPGEAAYNCAVLNTMLAREGFRKSSTPGGGDGFPLSYADPPPRGSLPLNVFSLDYYGFGGFVCHEVDFLGNLRIMLERCLSAQRINPIMGNIASIPTGCRIYLAPSKSGRRTSYLNCEPCMYRPTPLARLRDLGKTNGFKKIRLFYIYENW
ncbi:conserved hypothetical protein [Histoplasma mississippiense (nom. inval.)]|uniref:conserved hypothetical protein n=1 Tax=Ajellomyces capsulatus (strain NAm1 / WU24) TaxID=2059318 RepID=UPI000157B411|nr:conserved hypothetical protein [Histoplasma mississippiense (nom. inval.)]EDN02756.1 conserved hypothetical protein [Histoplasma mississippiense (nom. inval.)]